MGSYNDTSWADLRALTRLRRAQRARTVYYAVGEDGVGLNASRSRECAWGWKRREWRSGNRRCGYCGGKTRLKAKGFPPDLATVDHRHPVVLGGDDAAWNWLIACLRCNGRKGHMTEADFRARLKVERLTRIAA